MVERSGRGDPATALRQSAGSIASRFRGDAEDLPALLRVLEDATTGPGGDHPLTEFVSRLAELQGPGLHGQLQDWIDAFVRRTGLSRPLPRTDTGPRRSYLTIQFEEDGLDPHSFLMSVRLEEGGSAGVVLHQADVPIRLDEAERRVGQAIKDADEAIAHLANQMVIEFVLPLALLNQPLEYWSLDLEGDREAPIALYYPVVFRSLERLRDRSLHRQWRARWDAALLEAEPAMRWAEHGDRRELRQAIREGIPAIAWVRGGHDPQAVGELHDLLKRTKLTDLPNKVAEIRRASLAAERRGPGHWLQLLYDDPNRLAGGAMELRIPEASEETA